MERQITLFEQSARLPRLLHMPRRRIAKETFTSEEPLLKKVTFFGLSQSIEELPWCMGHMTNKYTRVGTLRPLIHNYAIIRDDVTDRATATHDIRDATHARWDRESDRN